MAITYTDNGGGAANGSDLEFTFTFPVIQTEDVKVALNGVTQATTKYAVDTASNPTKIIFNNTSVDSNVQESTGAPKSGVAVRVFRQTTVGKSSGDDDPKAVYAAGSSIRATDLNANTEQALYAIHELQDQPLTDANIEDGAITSAKIADGTIANVDVSSTAAIAGTKISPDFGSQNIATTGTGATGNLGVTGNITVSGTVDGRDLATDGTKLDGIETAATADQTAAEIRTLVESATDSNVFTDADHTKLNGIETAATADQTDAEIRTAVEAATDSNVFTDADHTKLDGIDTGATDDQTASEIKTLIASSPLDSSHLAPNSVTTSEIADAELTTLAGMQSATASKLADSTALTADIADLNQLDGLTKQTTITGTDASFPTSNAVINFVIEQLAPLGGFEVVADETSFPNTQPASGVVISIADAGGLVVSATGTASGQTVGGTTVNITGIASNFNSSTIAAGIRFLVTSTGSGQNYTYHKATLKEDDLISLSGDINDFSERYRVGSSNPTSSLDSGDLFFNTSTGKLLVYNGTNSAWEEAQSIGNFFISTLSPAFDGTTQDFTLTNAPTLSQQILLSINGVVQKPNAGSSTPSEGFALAGSTVKLSAAPATGSTYHAVVMGSTVNIGTPSDNTVTSAILQNGSVITAKLADQAVDLSKLPHGTGSTDGKFLRANNGADPTFETVNTDLVADTSPQLGGDLASNSNDILMADSDKVVFGTGGDLSIQHTGGTSDITNSTSNLNFVNNADSAHVNFIHSNEYMLRAASDGAVELYYDNSKKLETTSGGIDLPDQLQVDGTVFATGGLKINSDSARLRLGASDDLQIYHGSNTSYIVNGTGNLEIQGGSNYVDIKSDGFRVKNGADNETIFNAVANGAVELYHDNSKKIETTADGVTVTGTVTDSKGKLRSIPQNNQTSSAYTLVASDAGKHIHTDQSITIPNNVFAVGDAITIVSVKSSDLSITQGSGLTMYNAGDASTGNRTLATRGMVTILFTHTSYAYISGAGLS